MGDTDRLIRLHISDSTFRQVDVHIHAGIVHDANNRFSLLDPDVRSIMRQVDNHTVERSRDVHLFQIELTVLEVVAGVRHLYLRIAHLAKRHTALFVKGFLLHLLLLGYFEAQFFGVDRNAVLILFVFEADDQLPFGNEITQLKGLTGTRVRL